MYSRRIVESRVEIASLQKGFPLVYHSVDEIEDFTTRMERRHADAYAAARRASQGTKEPTSVFQSTLNKLLCNPLASRLDAEESRWIQNERMLVMCDVEYFLTRYYWILNTQNELQRFSFAERPGQKILFNIIAELEEMGIAIEILIAKARQLGMTTLVEGLLLQKILFSHGVNAVSASADQAKTREMVKKILMAYDKLPWWLRPVYTRRVESDNGFMHFGLQDSGITFQHGQQTNPIAMGSTVVTYHLSEVSSYPDPQETIEVGLFKAVHPSPRVLGILESTCKGNTGWWHDTYWDAKAEWKNHRSRLMALFLPFYCATNLYPNPTEKISHPPPKDWRPAKETRQMMQESEAYVQSNPVLAKVMMARGKPWKLNRDQAWYWERNFMSSRAKGNEKDWFQEMPHSDRVAFQSSYESVFGKDVIAEVESQRAKQDDYDVFGLRGQSIEERHEPDEDEIDHSLPIISIRYRSRKGTTYSWEAVPLKWEEPFGSIDEIRDQDSHMGKLFIYAHPEKGYDYAIGVRTSNGIGDDPTVIAVCRRARNDQEQDIQVAEFRDIEVSHVEAFAFSMAIAAYYSTFMKPEHGMVRHREPYVAIEQMKSVGDTCQLNMRLMGYRRFHHMTRYDSKPEDMRKFKARKIGWFTGAWSEPMLTDGFVILARNGWYKVNSPWTIWEMDHWEVHGTGSGKDKYVPSEDATAHGLYANAMAAFCPNDMKPLADRTAKRFMEVGGAVRKPTLDIEPPLSGTSFPLSPLPPSNRLGRLTLNVRT
jgi:hypothetical protein